MPEKLNHQLLSVVPTGSAHLVEGRRTRSFPSITVDILSTRQIHLTQWSLRRFADPYWRLYWPISDGGMVEIDHAITPLCPGCLYLIPPHTVFSTRIEKPFTKWYSHFKLGRLADRAAPGIYEFAAPENMRELVQQFEQPEHPTSYFPWHTVNFVTQALSLLPEEVWSSHRLDPRLLRALEFMNDHLAVKLSIEQIARHSGLSSRNLNHLFKKHLQQTPMSVLLGYRLDEACRLLRTSDASIDAIAESCGLLNRHYFSRLLRQHRNLSPAAYRAEQRRLLTQSR